MSLSVGDFQVRTTATDVKGDRRNRWWAPDTEVPKTREWRAAGDTDPSPTRNDVHIG
jgi:hypothetical protein